MLAIYKDFCVFYLMCTFCFGILDFAYSRHNCDLLCWRELVSSTDKPLLVLLLLGGTKILLILLLTLLSYADEPSISSPRIEPSIASIKRRYCRFILMRLLEARRKSLLLKEADIVQGHARLQQAIAIFRRDARKLNERTDLQLLMPLQQVLHVDEIEEWQLLRRFKEYARVREVDLYRLVRANP
ncbi:uncharacterized protein LOC108599276 [Drosophila busckii]|uniref:uncharacterized protein LOC108599276 n=1 Tax=Drosophila busckii TaxID=30019 RepID=UPI00083F15AF|nr:uncharacterized protein LOC108599276 [Drosophila busckii]